MFGFLWKKRSRKQSQNNIFIADNVQVKNDTSIGYGTCIGTGDIEDGPIVIGKNVTIGAYCLISFGTKIGDNVTIDDYCKVSAGVTIGDNSRLLYGKHIYDDVQIGKNCIIGGHVADRTCIEDNVTYMGEIAHSHRHPDEDWDLTEEPSPVIKKGSVVGVNAILIGGIEIGPCAYVGAGEIVRTNVPEGMCYIKGKIESLKKYRGIFKSRCQ